MMKIFSDINLPPMCMRKSTTLITVVVATISLLVGSCKISGTPDISYSQSTSIKFKEALFPKSSIMTEASETNGDSRAHRAYIARARSLVQRNPKSLEKLSQQEIGFIFGEPTFSRKDADARVWQYKTNSCVIDFYFYEENKMSAKNPVSYIDMRFKEELYPGSASRTSVSEQEQSRCLNDAVAQSMRSKSRA